MWPLPQAEVTHFASSSSSTFDLHLKSELSHRWVGSSSSFNSSLYCLGLGITLKKVSGLKRSVNYQMTSLISIAKCRWKEKRVDERKSDRGERTKKQIAFAKKVPEILGRVHSVQENAAARLAQRAAFHVILSAAQCDETWWDCFDTTLLFGLIHTQKVEFGKSRVAGEDGDDDQPYWFGFWIEIELN